MLYKNVIYSLHPLLTQFCYRQS